MIEQADTPFYRWFLIIFSLIIFVLCIINAIQYNNVLNQYNSQPDVEQDVGRGWARALYGLNITLAVVASLVWSFQLYKVITGKTKIDLVAKVKKFFGMEETLADVKKALEDKGLNPDQIQNVITLTQDNKKINEVYLKNLEVIFENKDKSKNWLKYILKYILKKKDIITASAS
jgi:hypothetical protein